MRGSKEHKQDSAQPCGMAVPEFDGWWLRRLALKISVAECARCTSQFGDRMRRSANSSREGLIQARGLSAVAFGALLIFVMSAAPVAAQAVASAGAFYGGGEGGWTSLANELGNLPEKGAPKPGAGDSGLGRGWDMNGKCYALKASSDDKRMTSVQ